MNFIIRSIQRLIILIAGTASIWLIVTQVFGRLNDKLPLLITLTLTYLISAYLILPQITHFTSFILRKGKIPRRTRTTDGLVADPVNIILSGTTQDLTHAFFSCGWVVADRITISSAYKMLLSFILNKPYPRAPFSSLYLFGRKQDVGFQESISNSPRKRNHVRFWATNNNPSLNIFNKNFWFTKSEVDFMVPVLWVGAATKDEGFGLRALTYKITHRVNKNIDNERDYILQTLKSHDCIDEVKYINPGELIDDKYISDGKIVFAKLKTKESQKSNG